MGSRKGNKGGKRDREKKMVGGKVKGKLQAQEVKVPRFHDNGTGWW